MAGKEQSMFPCPASASSRDLHVLGIKDATNLSAVMQPHSASPLLI